VRETRAANIHRTNEWDVLVDRSSPWGNPFIRAYLDGRVRTKAECVRLHREMLLRNPARVEAARPDLEGKILGCHCLPEACHATNWADAMNRVGEFAP
jgi:uncharacterized protein DUF4326